jgi:hypothetical protein
MDEKKNDLEENLLLDHFVDYEENKQFISLTKEVDGLRFLSFFSFFF